MSRPQDLKSCIEVPLPYFGYIFAHYAEWRGSLPPKNPADYWENIPEKALQVLKQNIHLSKNPNQIPGPKLNEAVFQNECST